MLPENVRRAWSLMYAGTSTFEDAEPDLNDLIPLFGWVCEQAEVSGHVDASFYYNESAPGYGREGTNRERIGIFDRDLDQEGIDMVGYVMDPVFEVGDDHDSLRDCLVSAIDHVVSESPEVFSIEGVE